MNRNLDGIYFKVERNGKYENVCFSDLTDEEMNEVLSDKSQRWLASTCKLLGKTIQQIGIEQNIVKE